MKKLRLFDSLKLVLATVACVFILNVAHADTPNCANYIDYTSATGTVSQSGTPTPTNPVTSRFYTQNEMVLRAVGNVADSYDATTGKITRRVGVKVLDGTETGWTKLSDVNYVSLTKTTISNIASGTDATCLSNNFVQVPHGSISLSEECFSVGASYVNFKKAGNPTVAQFKQWLADQYAAGTPVIVVYPLATPVTEDWPSRQCEYIKIATTRYNEEQFAPVKTDLSAAVNAVEYVVSNTMTQAQQIDQIANEKQTRPDEGCDAKYCLLVEDEDGTPHWYPIAGANGVAHALPAGYTELQYIESDGASWIDTGIAPTATTLQIDYKMQILQKAYVSLFGAVAGTTPRNGFRIYYQPSDNTNSLTFQAGAATVNQAFTWNDVLEGSVVVKQGTSIVSTINGNTINRAATGANLTQSATILVGTSYVGSGVSGLTPMKIWSFKITKNGAVVFNGVPAKNANDEIGMYDLVGGQFHANDGTGVFTGPEM